MSIIFVDKIEDADGITHGEGFHADDIYCIALLEKLFGTVKIYRIPHEEALNVDFDKLKAVVFDIGNGKYDHHQKEGAGFHYQILPGKDPIPYASFGLLWNDFGVKLLKKLIPNQDGGFYSFMNTFVEYNLARYIDLGDNGKFPKTRQDDESFKVLSLSAVVSWLNPLNSTVDIEPYLQAAIMFAGRTISAVIELGKLAYKSFRLDIDTHPTFKEYERVICAAIEKRFSKLKNRRYPVARFNQRYPYCDIEAHWNANAENFCYLVDEKHGDFIMDQMKYFIDGICGECNDAEYAYPNNIDELGLITFGQIFCDNNYDIKFDNDLTTIFDYMFDYFLELITLKIKAEDIVADAIESGKESHIMILNEKLPWHELLYKVPGGNRIWFAITPTDTGCWNVRPVTCKSNPNGFRKGFPKAWWGYTAKDGENKIVDGLIFIHQEGIKAVAKTREAAIELCIKSLSHSENIQK